MEFPLNPEHRLRVETLAPAMVTVLVLAALQPLAVIVATILPLRFDDISWRFQVFALFVGASPQIAVELAILAAIGLFGEQYRAVRGAAVGALVLGATLVPVLLFEILDYLEVRHLVPADRVRGFDLTTLQAIAVGAAFVPLLLWLGRRGLGRRCEKSVRAMNIDDHLVAWRSAFATAPYDPRVNNLVPANPALLLGTWVAFLTVNPLCPE